MSPTLMVGDAGFFVEIVNPNRISLYIRFEGHNIKAGGLSDISVWSVS